MNDKRKTKEQLIAELQKLRHRNFTLEAKLVNLQNQKNSQISHNLFNFLSLTTTELLELPLHTDFYAFIAKTLYKIVADSSVLVSSFDKTTNQFCLRSIIGFEKEIKSFFKKAGLNIIKSNYPINNEALVALKSGQIAKVPGGLYELACGGLDRSFCLELERVLHIHQCHAIGFSWNEELYGSAVILSHQNTELDNYDMITAFVRQASIALQRRQAEEQLRNHRNQLEMLVQKGTASLRTANRELERKIKQHERAKKTIIESELKYRALFESAHDATFLMKDQYCIDCNTQTLRMYACKKEQIIGKTVEDFSAKLQPDGRDANEKSLELIKITKRVGHQLFEWKCKRLDGALFDAEVSLNPVRLGHDIFTLAIVRDVTERKHAEQKIVQSMQEKEVLLKEIHHRVKNNMQVISSLLNLQANFIDDEKTIKVLQDSRTRVRSMALVHEALYNSDNLSCITMPEYVKNLTDNLLNIFSNNMSLVHVQMHVDNISLPIEIAIPCGLIMNELISNSFKHAFGDKQHGLITISFKEKNNQYLLTISDDGQGLPQNFNLNNINSLGFQLVTSLAFQIDAQIKFTNPNGCQFTIVFDKNN